MARAWEDPEVEESTFDALKRARQQRRSISRSETAPALARSVERSRDFAPWMKGAVHLGLAKRGVDPSSPTYAAAAKGSIKAQAKRGLGWHSVGEVVERVADASSTATRGAVRALTTALSAPIEEGQAQFRRAAAGGNPLASYVPGSAFALGGAALGRLMDDEIQASDDQPLFQSSAAVAAGRLAKGERVDLGKGFFPGGAVRAEQVRRARTVQVGGRSLTPGRGLAVTVTEPGTRPFNILSGFVDASVALADPTASALKVAGQARKAHKFFTAADAAEAGLVRGRRPAVIADQVERWIDSPKATKLAESLAEDTDFLSIWQRTRKQVPVETVLELKHADDPVAVKEIMRRAVLGGDLREKLGEGPLSELGLSVRRAKGRVRLLQMMPGSHVDMDDIDSAVEQVDRFLRNAKVDDATISRHLEEVAKAKFGPERLAALKPVMESVQDALVAHGMDAADARSATTMFQNSVRDMRRYFVNEVGHNARVPGVLVGETGEPLASPHLFVEYLNREVPLPDAREIRRTVSAFAPLFKVPGVNTSVAFADAFVQNLWKPLVLLRGAWTAKVIGEEQIRMGASGLSSAFNHPLSYIAYAMGKKGALDVTGKPLDDAEEFLQAMSRGSAGFRDAKKIVTSHKRIVERGEDIFAESWVDELGQLAADPIASKIANEGVDAVRNSFWDGELSFFRHKLADAQPEFNNRLFADDWLDSVAERISIKTGGDPELLDLVRTGKWGDARVIGDNLAPADGLLEALAAKAEAGIGPRAVKGNLIIYGKTGSKGEAGAAWDRAVESFFGVFMSKPTNIASRSETFKQFYWKRVGEIAELAKADEAAKIVKAARAANLDAVQVGSIQSIASRAAGELSADDIDAIAKAFALDETRKLLFDLSNRSQFADVLRIVAPFAEAWREIVTTWARIGRDNPQTIRRAQQLVEGARGNGFFYTDQTTGEEVFNYPGSEFATGALLDMPTPLVGSARGLNLVGASVLPGLGPVMQIPLSKLIPNKPDYDWLREFALPFGDPDMSQGALESQLPAWFQKLRKMNDDPESDRVFGNTVADVMRYLVSTGDYSTNTPEEIDKLMVDATRKARILYGIRGVAQFFAPTAPRPQAVAEVDGRTVVAQHLLDDFQKMQEEDYDSAVLNFLAKYGEDALLYMQPKTRSLGGKLPTDEAGNDWARENPDIEKRYPLVHGFFAPTGGDFSFAAYDRQLKSGQRESLSPEEAVKLANNTRASLIYRQAKERAGSTPDGKAWLRQVREALREEFPGYGETLTISQKAKTPDLVRELEKAANDPALARTELGEALGIYFTARQKAQAAAEEIGLASFGQATSAAHIREWLREVADEITREYPAFAETFEMALSREMRDDDPEPEPETEELEE